MKENPAGVVQSTWLDPPLLIKGQLPSQEQDFRTQDYARAQRESEEMKPICDLIGDQFKQRIQ